MRFASWNPDVGYSFTGIHGCTGLGPGGNGVYSHNRCAEHICESSLSQYLPAIYRYLQQPSHILYATPCDDTLAMAGHIEQALAAGRTVVVELMTRGMASSAFLVSGENDSSFLYDHTQGCGGADYTHLGPEPTLLLILRRWERHANASFWIPCVGWVSRR